MKLFSLLYQGDVHPSADEKIVKQEDYSTLLSAASLVEKAREDAEALLAKTKKECVLLAQRAKEEGHKEGLEQFQAHILKMDENMRILQHNLQQLVLPIALKAARRIVGKQLDLFPETIVDIVKQAMAPIAGSRRVTLFVNKEDKEILDHNKPQLKEILSQIETFTIQEKADVEKGCCIIQTESGMITVKLEDQLNALKRVFEKYKP